MSKKEKEEAVDRIERKIENMRLQIEISLLRAQISIDAHDRRRRWSLY